MIARAQLKNLHLMESRRRTTRLCGATTGAFARVSERRWIAKFLRSGGALCAECAKAAPDDIGALFERRTA